MSAPWVPPQRTYHLRLFAAGLALVLLCLGGLLFFVQLDAVAPATGNIRSLGEQEIRARVAGLVEPGWYEAFLAPKDGEPIPVRLDAQGEGITNPKHGPVQTVQLALEG